MTIPYRTFLALGLAVGLLGASYVFAPQPGAAALPTAPMPKAAAVANAATSAAPTVKPTSTLVANRAPVPLAPRKHYTYYVPKEADPAVQTASATAGRAPSGTASTDGSTASAIVGAGIDGGLMPSNDAKTGGGQAKAAIELDGYKNVRALEKGPDGIWRGRAMRGRTEIAVRVDATGSVSAD